MVKKLSFLKKLLITLVYTGGAIFICLIKFAPSHWEFLKPVFEERESIMMLAPFCIIVPFGIIINRVPKFEYLEPEKKKRALLYLIFIPVVHFYYYIWKQDDLLANENNYLAS